MSHTYALGAVKPWVRAAAQEVGDKFDVSTIFGVGARAEPSDHPLGLATDFMVYGDKAKGDQIYAYGKANWSRLAIKYIIWYQQIDEGSGLKPMEDRGGKTANHQDHNHWSYTNNGGSSGTNTGTTTGTGVGSASDDGGASKTTAALTTVTSPSTWTRILEFLAGTVLIILALWPVISRVSGGLI